MLTGVVGLRSTWYWLLLHGGQTWPPIPVQKTTPIGQIILDVKCILSMISLLRGMSARASGKLVLLHTIGGVHL